MGFRLLKNCHLILDYKDISPYRFIFTFEPWSDVNVRVVGDDVEEGHDGHQPQHQVDGDPGLVHGPRLLLGVIPRDEVAQAHGGQGDEAVVERVEQRPDRLHDVQQDGGEEDEQEENDAAHQTEMKNPERRKLNLIPMKYEDKYACFMESSL